MRCAKLLHIVLAGALLVGASGPATAQAGTAATAINVRANVLPWVKYDTVQHVSSYTVRREDISRGYVDIPGAVTVNIRTNVRKDVAVRAEHDQGRQLLLRASGMQGSAQSVSTIDTSGHGRGEMITQRLDARVILPSETKEGIHSLVIPLSLEI